HAAEWVGPGSATTLPAGGAAVPPRTEVSRRACTASRLPRALLLRACGPYATGRAVLRLVRRRRSVRTTANVTRRWSYARPRPSAPRTAAGRGRTPRPEAGRAR